MNSNMKFIKHSKNDEELKNKMISNLNKDISSIVGSFSNDILGAVALLLAEYGIDIEHLSSMFSIENYYGDLLTQKVFEETGEIRRKATKARGYITIEAEKHIKIPKDTLVITKNNLTFQTLEDKNILNNKENILVECVEYGPIGNINAYEIYSFLDNIPGVNKVYNQNSFTTGFYQESDKELIKRYYEYKRNNITSANLDHYKYWAKQVEGVGDVFPKGLWNGPNTVLVIITNDNNKKASPELINKVQNYIDPIGDKIGDNMWTTWGKGRGKAPIGAFCTVKSAIPIDIYIHLTIVISSNSDINQIKNNIYLKINTYFKSLGLEDNYISYAKVGALILSVDGVMDYKDLKINNFQNGFYIKDEEIPNLKEVIVNE